MSLVAKLENKRNQIGHVDEAIADLVRGISVLDILNDPALILPDKVSKSNEQTPQSISLYQLNARLKEIEDSNKQLNEFWVIKNLFHEVELALEQLSGEVITTDKTELLNIVSGLEKLQGKISRVSDMNLAIVSSMTAKYDGIIVTFSAALARIFHMFIPMVSPPNYIVYGEITTEEKSLSFLDFFDVAKAFETLHPSGLVSEKLALVKSDWERSILEPLISQRTFLKLTIHEDGYHNLEVVDIDRVTGFSMDSFFHSLQGFVHFVNATNLKPLKNFYSTKISNGLADIISENIQYFTDDTDNLTQKLMQTLELFSSSGWTVPLRNIFMAQSDIRDTLKGLHLNWITDRYIDELRSIFTGSEFEDDLQNQKTITHTIEVNDPVPQIVVPPQTVIQQTVQIPQENINPVLNDESEELEWDDNWGSDDDDFEAATKKSENSDAWDDNWDEGWSDDDESHVQKVQPKLQPKIQPKIQTKAPVQLQKIPHETSHQSVIRETNQMTPPPKTHTESYVIVVSAIPEKLTRLLSDFERDTDGANTQILMDTIFSLALTSYPLIAHLFLMLNDLRSVESSNLYLRDCVDAEWQHFCQSFSGDITKILLKPGLLECNTEVEFGETNFESISQIKVAMHGLVGSQLRSTNSHELKLFVLQVLNLINNIVLQKILRCEEITEYQSEEFTRYLENLQVIEEETLAQFGEDLSVLATANKVMQTKFLINNHLKSIMEYFYQGELYDFSTDELVSVIKSVFIPSDLRENCLNEIIDVRSS